MITVRAGNAAIGVWLLLLVAGCSREQQDWRSAEAADTIEGYDQFVQHHPESELATQARTRVTQLGEDRDWQHAGSADTVNAYRQFLTDHPNGKWAQEARIRIENFSLAEQGGVDAGSKAGAGETAPRAGQRSSLAAADVAAAATGAPATVAPRVAAAGPAAPPRGAPEATATVQGVAATVPGAAATAPGAAGAGPVTPPRAVSGAATVPGAAERMSSAASPGGFGIQLGAFGSEASASGEWRTLTARFGPELLGLHQHIVTADTSSGRIYRLQAAVGDEARARAICESLRKRSQACVAVLPH